MLHLSSDRLSALADAEPTPLEAEHLSTCATCAHERAANRALVMMARGERDQLGVPLTRWDSLAPELHRAGLVAAGALMSAPPATGTGSLPGRAAVRRAALWLQAASVLLLISGGAALGRVSAGESPLPFLSQADRPEQRREPRTDGVSPAVTAPANANAYLPEFHSIGEAIAALQRYEVAYQHAARFLADHDSSTRVDDSHAYRARLVALDRANRAVGEALREAPYDPVLNGFYLTTLGQRRATIRQLEASMPSQRIRSF